MLVTLLAAVPAALAAPLPAHPTLPTMWESLTNDPPMGDGIEAYYFVDVPTPGNPSAMWSNYTDCQRLIFDGDLRDEARYLLHCDSVDCCHEAQEGNQVEFQIPNVHPPELTEEFKHEPGQSFINHWGQTKTCDKWSWRFTEESWEVYTTPCPSCVNNVTLWRWHVEAFEERVSIDFQNYTAIPESRRTEFRNRFFVPEECKADNLPECDDLRAQGLLRPRPLTASEKVAAWREAVYAKNGRQAPPLRA